MAIQFDVPGEAMRLERAARRARVESLDLGRVQPLAARTSRRPGQRHSRARAAAGQRRAGHAAGRSG